MDTNGAPAIAPEVFYAITGTETSSEHLRWWQQVVDGGDAYSALRNHYAPPALYRLVPCSTCGAAEERQCTIGRHGPSPTLAHTARRADAVRLARYIDILWGNG